MDPPLVQYATTSDGQRIAYCVGGTGLPLVMMPAPYNNIALFWNSPRFRNSYTLLAARFRLIRYDNRGQGMSSRGLSQDHSPQLYQVDLETIVGQLGLERFILYAPHTAAILAIRYASQHSERVRALILWNPESVRRNSIPPAIDDLAAQKWDLFVEAQGRTIFSLEDPALAKRFVAESTTQADWLMRARSWDDLGDLEAMLPRLDVPTLLLATRASAWAQSTEGSSTIMAGLIPNCRLALFDDAGGGLFSDYADTPPGIVAIQSFVDSLPPERQASGSSALPDGLSGRELEVLRLIIAGKSNQQIADELVISHYTVQRHVSNILTKTGLANRTEAAIYARDHGLV